MLVPGMPINSTLHRALQLLTYFSKILKPAEKKQKFGRR